MNSTMENTPRMRDAHTRTKLRVLAIIAARGGSKGIRFKNIEFLNGKPLIHYVLRTAESTGLIDDVIVSSDSEELLEYSASLATMTRLRPAELAGDDVTLDPVIYDAVKYAEEQCGMPCGAKS